MDTVDKDVEAAESQLFAQVFVPAFVKQCSARGVDIANEEDLEHMLKIAQQLQANGVTVDAAPASTTSLVIKEASRRLDAALGGGERSTLVDAAVGSPEVKSAMAVLARAARAAAPAGA